jgi:hypothetical protein
VRDKFTAIAAAAILAVLFSTAAFAQTGQLRGSVRLKQADDSLIPIDGALVEVMRLDIAGIYTTKTNSEGEFIFAGLPFVGTYLLSVSAPNARPTAIGEVKAGTEMIYEVILEVGNGQQLTRDEALAVARLKVASPPIKSYSADFLKATRRYGRSNTMKQSRRMTKPSRQCQVKRLF